MARDEAGVGEASSSATSVLQLEHRDWLCPKNSTKEIGKRGLYLDTTKSSSPDRFGEDTSTLAELDPAEVLVCVESSNTLQPKRHYHTPKNLAKKIGKQEFWTSVCLPIFFTEAGAQLVELDSAEAVRVESKFSSASPM